MSQSEQPTPRRGIRSFTLRQGRFSQGQQRAYSDHWAEYGLTLEQGALNPERVFGRQAPLVLEIGYGMGQSLAQMAAAEPDKDFIGIEVHQPGVGSLLSQIAEAGLTNLRTYHTDAMQVLAQCIAAQSLARVQIFFPDPWPKKRHHKRRLIQPEVVALLGEKLAPGGVLHLATDWQPYAEHMLEVLQQALGLDNLYPETDYAPRPEQRPLTKFEQRGQRLGHGVWDLMFRKS